MNTDFETNFTLTKSLEQIWEFVLGVGKDKNISLKI